MLHPSLDARNRDGPPLRRALAKRQGFVDAIRSPDFGRAGGATGALRGGAAGIERESIATRRIEIDVRE